MTTTATPTTVPSARAVSTATISIGLIQIHTKIYTSKESAHDISFNVHHAADGGRLKQQYVCTVCNEVVDREHTVRGYEHAKGQSVLFSAAELEALEALSTKAMNVQEFVDFDELDPLYIEGTSYLGPDKGSERGFQLLHDVLVETGKVAIASHAASGKERIVAIRALGGGLAFHPLRYASEVRSSAGVPVTGVESNESQVALMTDLVSRMSGTFDPSAYVDTVQQRIAELIQKKIDGGEIVVQPAETATTPDLLEALRASLDLAPPVAASSPTNGHAKRAIAKTKRTPRDRVRATATKKTKAKPTTTRRASAAR